MLHYEMSKNNLVLQRKHALRYAKRAIGVFNYSVLFIKDYM